MPAFYKRSYSDIAGIISSSVCLIHCIATPILIMTGLHFFTNPVFEFLFLGISGASVYQSTKSEFRSRTSILLWISFIGLSTTILLHHFLEWMHVFSYFFTILIISGHIIQIKTCPHCMTDEVEN